MNELPPPDISHDKVESAADHYAASGNASLKRPSMAPHIKVGFNLIAALIFTGLSTWLLVADLQYPGDLLFQLSISLPVLALFLIGFSITAFVFAVFPKRIVFIANLLFILRAAIGFPLTIWIDNSTAAIALSAALLALSLYYLAGSLRRFHGIEDRPWMNFPHSLAILGIGILLTILAIPCTLLGYTHAGRNLMGDYVRLSHEALSLVERVFQKGDQRVHLVGMMHIGSGAYYTDLQQRISTSPEDETARRLVLTEGVSDEKKILPANFTSGKTYARWARVFDLEVQEAFHNPGFGGQKAGDHFSPDNRILFRNADIDVSELDPTHQETLVSLLSLLDETDPLKLLLAQPEGITGTDIEDLFFKALIGSRNDVLMDEFHKAAPEYQEIYIPWGAAHLSDFEERLLDQGYEQVDEIIRPIISFW